jgi:hypothetical protein
MSTTIDDNNIDNVESNKQQKHGKQNHHHFHKEWTNPIEFLMVCTFYLFSITVIIDYIE